MKNSYDEEFDTDDYRDDVTEVETMDSILEETIEDEIDILIMANQNWNTIAIATKGEEGEWRKCPFARFGKDGKDNDSQENENNADNEHYEYDSDESDVQANLSADVGSIDDDVEEGANSDAEDYAAGAGENDKIAEESKSELGSPVLDTAPGDDPVTEEEVSTPKTNQLTQSNTISNQNHLYQRRNQIRVWVSSVVVISPTSEQLHLVPPPSPSVVRYP